MSTLLMHAPSPDRTRANTWPLVTARLDRDAERRVRRVARRAEETTDALDALDREWDIDRVIESEAPLMGLLGLALGVTWDRRLLALPAVVSTMLVIRATHGWYPLLPFFRRMGVRSADEIARERHALKAARGDFDEIRHDDEAARRADAAWKAVWA